MEYEAPKAIYYAFLLTYLYTNSKGGKHDDSQSYSVPQIVTMIWPEFNVPSVIFHSSG